MNEPAPVAALAPWTSAPATRDAKRLRVLVVEDSDLDYALIVATLARHGWAVEATRVHDEPSMRLALFNQFWDLVIADYRLPGFSGIEALEIAQRSGLHVPFILVSGAIGEEAAVAALHAGAADCIAKDSIARLPPAIERSLAAAEAHRERRRAELLLRANVEWMTVLLNASPLAIVALSLAGEVTLWNAAAERLFGRTAAEAIGHLPPIVAPEDLERFLAIQDRALAGGLQEGEFAHRYKDGATLPLSYSMAALRGSDGKPVGTITLLADISERKRAEQALRDSREQLRALSAHVSRAIESERAHLARELHDDVGGTLTALRAEIDGLRSRLPPGAAAAIQRLDHLAEEVMAGTVAISRALRPSMLDTGIVPALEWQAREFRERSGIACEFSHNDAALALDADQSIALFRIFQEALTNVAKHASARRVRAELFSDASAVTLEVSDDGTGLPADALAKRDSFGVRGMRERVRALGGWLEISGGRGAGTTVMASLPRVTPAAGGEA